MNKYKKPTNIILHMKTYAYIFKLQMTQFESFIYLIIYF